MNEVKTWQTRCEEHSDHQDRIVTEQMVRNRMQEEIDELRAKLDALEKQEPVAYFEGSRIYGQQDVTILKLIPAGSKLYLAAGAQKPITSLRAHDVVTIESLQDKMRHLEQRRELTDAEIQAAIDSVHTYTGDYAHAIARAVLTAAGGAE